MEFEIREEGIDAAIRFRAVKDFKDDIIATMERAAHEAGTYMATHAPYHSGALYRSINVGPIVYRPGGAGGGGFYEIEVGVNEEMAPHARYVIEGTGIYGESPTNGIFPTNRKFMAFDKMGEETVFTRWTRGQRPQREWFEDAQELAQNIISRAIHGI